MNEKVGYYESLAERCNEVIRHSVGKENPKHLLDKAREDYNKVKSLPEKATGVSKNSPMWDLFEGGLKNEENRIDDASNDEVFRLLERESVDQDDSVVEAIESLRNNVIKVCAGPITVEGYHLIEEAEKQLKIAAKKIKRARNAIYTENIGFPKGMIDHFWSDEQKADVAEIFYEVVTSNRALVEINKISKEIDKGVNREKTLTDVAVLGSGAKEKRERLAKAAIASAKRIDRDEEYRVIGEVADWTKAVMDLYGLAVELRLGDREEIIESALDVDEDSWDWMSNALVNFVSSEVLKDDFMEPGVETKKRRRRKNS